jgi:hypothetical protein
MSSIKELLTHAVDPTSNEERNLLDRSSISLHCYESYCRGYIVALTKKKLEMTKELEELESFCQLLEKAADLKEHEEANTRHENN